MPKGSQNCNQPYKPNLDAPIRFVTPWLSLNYKYGPEWCSKTCPVSILRTLWWVWPVGMIILSLKILNSSPFCPNKNNKKNTFWLKKWPKRSIPTNQEVSSLIQGFLNSFEMTRFVKANQDEDFDAIAQRFKLNKEQSGYVLDYLRNIIIDFLFGGFFVTELTNNILFKNTDYYVQNMLKVPILEGGTINHKTLYQRSTSLIRIKKQLFWKLAYGSWLYQYYGHW